MAATQTCHANLNGYVVGIGVNLLIFHCGGNVNTTGAADDELAHVLIIDIQQDVALQGVGAQVVNTVHAGLLVGSNQSLQRSVLYVL